MSRKIRFAAALLVLACLATGSLEALPFGSRQIHAQRSGGFIDAIVEWVMSLFTSADQTSRPPTKEGGIMDPNGSPGGPH